MDSPQSVNFQQPTQSSPATTERDVAALLEELRSANAKKQLALLDTLAAQGEPGHTALMQFLPEAEAAIAVRGKAYQLLRSANTAPTQDFLAAQFPQGVVPLASATDMDYAPLQALLAAQHFQEADRLTLQTLCQLVGADAAQRKWLYFTEVKLLPVTDLRTIDALWVAHSEGKFGFSVQRDIWLSLGKNWDKLWAKIDWKDGNNWTRYPGGFTWDLSAPPGHLPLSNQLRGVRVIEAIFGHPAWEK